MAAINHVCISGNLVKDCEKKGSESTPIVNFSLASNERRKNSKTGEWEDYPNFVDCSIFGAFAKVISPQLVKGTKVVVSGKLRQSRWEKDGQKNSKISIIVSEIEIMKKESAGEQETIPFDGEPW